MASSKGEELVMLMILDPAEKKADFGIIAKAKTTDTLIKIGNFRLYVIDVR